MDEDKKCQPRYVAPDRLDGRLVAKGTLKHGLKFGTAVHREFVMREALAQDVFSAERDADSAKQITFAAEMISLQLISVGDYKGPFTRGMVGTLSQADFRRLREAQAELDFMGELE